MFVKTRKNQWINLNQCSRIEIQEKESHHWEIVFYYLAESDRIGPFGSDSEANGVLDKIWEASREGKPYFEPDPRKKMNVRLGDKWYAADKPIDAYFEAIQPLVEEIEARGLIFPKDRPIVTKKSVPGIAQKKIGEYWVLHPWREDSIIETLKSIASELEVDIEVTTYF